jgi:hypothetical protein
MVGTELEREGAATRRVLERVPEGRNDWKPHEKSMPLGYLAALVARMPAWAAMMIKQDELDFRAGRSDYQARALETNRELLARTTNRLRKRARPSRAPPTSTG